MDHFEDSAHMERLECVIVHRSMPLVSSSASHFHPDDLYYFSDVRDGGIVRKQSRLLKPSKHAAYNNDRGSGLCLLYVLRTRPGGERGG